MSAAICACWLIGRPLEAICGSLGHRASSKEAGDPTAGVASESGLPVITRSETKARGGAIDRGNASETGGA